MMSKRVGDMKGMIKTSNKGFTLIELMVVVIIIGIFTAIAVPTYRTYIMKSAEAKAQARLYELAIELESHKSTRLNYKGFSPKKVSADGSTVSYDYDADNTIIYVPKGSDGDNYKYQITLVDGATGASLADATKVTSSTSWRMIAQPNPTNTNLAKAEYYLVLSSGERCKQKVKEILTATSCTGKTSW